MESNDYTKEVYFDQYCKSCIHKNLAEDEKPCFECLQEPAREYSHRPAYYAEKK